MTLVQPSRYTVDTALEAEHYGPTSAISELALLTGYGPPAVPQQALDPFVDPRPCACGGWLAPDVASEIPAEIRRHNDTELHGAWRARMGIK